MKCLADETELRFREWIEQRRARVDQATDGRVGYVYVQSTGVDAQNELVRQFMAQWRKEALVIDERFNSGGQIPDRFIELLNRPTLAYWGVRDGEDWQWPPIAHRGPKVMLINGWSGSGGDAFPFYFREAELGPLIGTRTWGGLIGLSGSPGLVDGGNVTVPTFRMYDVRGKWFAEGHGVDPDIPVDEDPSQLAKGVDPQLERAIAEAMTQLKTAPAPARRSRRVRRSSGGHASRPCGRRRRGRRTVPPSARLASQGAHRGRPGVARLPDCPHRRWSELGSAAAPPRPCPAAAGHERGDVLRGLRLHARLLQEAEIAEPVDEADCQVPNGMPLRSVRPPLSRLPSGNASPGWRPLP